jgi:hypothetical protein
MANVTAAGVEHLVTIEQKDIFTLDLSPATVVTLYLLTMLNLKLRPRILALKPGTRVVSHMFRMGDWEPDERFNVEFRDAYLWYVPADVAGEWTVREESGGFEGVVSLTQKYQKVGGTLTFAGRQQPLLGASLQGDKLSFSFIDGESNLRTARLTVAKGTMIGELGWLGRNTTLVGRKRPAT